MAKESKRYKAIKANVEPQKQYGLREALELCKANATAKFNESVELHVRLGVDPRQADQQVRERSPSLTGRASPRGSSSSPWARS